MSPLTHYQGQAAIAELQRLQGVGLQPQPGSHIATLTLDGYDVKVEYDYSPGTAGRYSGPPEDCYPTEDEEIVFLNVLVNGHMISADLFVESQHEAWAEELRQQMQDARDDALAERARREPEYL